MILASFFYIFTLIIDYSIEEYGYATDMFFSVKRAVTETAFLVVTTDNPNCRIRS